MILLYCGMNKHKGEFRMKMKYQFRGMTKDQRAIIEYLLLDEMVHQNWYQILYLDFWGSEGLISVQ